MATLLLSTVGTAIAGPLGGIVGTFVGSSIDRSVLGGPSRQGPRLSDLAVQSSAYGEAIPRLYGTIRVAGNVIWSSGLRETKHKSGGKATGGRITTYSYSASLAVAISARMIRGVRRIWADGKLIRNAGGDFLVATQFRLHLGGEDQDVDPLIAAAEGAENTPTYRGLAYAVFEDLALAEFANRIPLLTFEVEADTDAPTLGEAIADLFAAASQPVPHVASVDRTVSGLGIGRAASIGNIVEMLHALQPLSLRNHGKTLEVAAGPMSPVALPQAETGCTSGNVHAESAQTQHGREALGSGAEVTLSFFDPARDYQGGLQRARRDGVNPVKLHHELPAVLQAGEAKRLAEELAARSVALRSTCQVSVPYRHAHIQPGDTVLLETHPHPWRVRRATLDRMLCELELEAVQEVTATDSRPSDAGRINVNPSAPHGPTMLRVLDIPAFTGDTPSAPRLWFAAAGNSPAWRRAEILVSTDGQDFVSAGQATIPATMGEALTALPLGVANLWDNASTLEVVLANEEMWLESRAPSAVLNGANLALVGNELIHFRDAVALSSKRFRLQGLLRGQFGTEWAMSGHQPGDSFVLLDPQLLTAADAPLAALGNEVWVKAVGPNEIIGEIAPQRLILTGRSLRPLSPVHLRASRERNGDIGFSWKRRSRQGYAWLDGTDAPLAEESERYLVRIRLASGYERQIDTVAEHATYLLADQVRDFGGPVSAVSLNVAQVSVLAGAGEPASRSFNIPY